MGPQKCHVESVDVQVCIRHKLGGGLLSIPRRRPVGRKIKE